MRLSLPAQSSLPNLFGVLPCLLAVLYLAPLLGAAEADPSEKRIQQLIEDLGNDRFEIREAATQALMEIEEVPPALYLARKSPNLEVRQRVTRILKALAPKRARKGLQRAQALAKAGRIIEAADRTVIWGELDSKKEGWDLLTGFADRMVERTADYFPPCGLWVNPQGPGREFLRLPKLGNPKEICQRKVDINIGVKSSRNQKELAWRKLIAETHGRLFLRGEEITFKGGILGFGLQTGIAAASADVHLMSATSSFIIVGGDAKITFLHRSIIICDGDVELENRPDDSCLIVARGNVAVARRQPKNCLIRSGHTLQLPDGKTIDIKDSKSDPLGFVKFFELADVGLAAEDLPSRDKSAAEGVRLKEVRKDSPFAAGLRAGDVIIAVEEKKTPTTKIFRRVLRRKLGEGGPIITITVRRSGKTLGVPIPVKD